MTLFYAKIKICRAFLLFTRQLRIVLIVKFTLIKTEENRFMLFSCLIQTTEAHVGLRGQVRARPRDFVRISVNLYSTLTHAYAIINFIYHVLFLPCISQPAPLRELSQH